MYQEVPRWAPLKLIESQERTDSFAFPLPSLAADGATAEVSRLYKRGQESYF